MRFVYLDRLQQTGGIKKKFPTYKRKLTNGMMSRPVFKDTVRTNTTHNKRLLQTRAL